jgi:peptide/nickel transport system substrate-binding protein
MAAVTGVAAGIAVLIVATVGAAAPSHVSKAAAGHKCLVMTGSGDLAFVRNFNPYTSTGIPSGQFVKGSVYEGLIVTPAGGLPARPWLASSWKWSNGNKTLTLNLVQNAKWSDGQPLTSADVVYSLKGGNSAAQQKVMDIVGFSRPGTNIASIAASGKYGVVIKLKTVDSQFISTTLNGAIVVPQHIWGKVSDPATFTNPHPVGSGPFNLVARFTTQDYVLGKNVHYWIAGKPLIPCLEYVQSASNDSALALIQSGQVDWTHNFVPNVEQAYQAKDKAHYHSFYATTAYPVSLVFDDTQYPYSLVAFRHALSQAIDRQSISKLGEYGYAPPTTALGLEFLFPQWVTDSSVKAQAKTLATYNPTTAKKTLTDAGFTYKGSQLIDPKGNAVNLGLVGLGRFGPDHRQEPLGDRDQLQGGARARLELLVSERIEHQEPDAALAGRRAGLAVRLLQRELLGELVHPVGTGRHEYRQLGALPERPGQRASPGMEGEPGSEEPAEDRNAAREDLAAAVADRAAVRRAALVHLQHEVLPLLRLAEEPLR